jgi:hypothetical protein
MALKPPDPAAVEAATALPRAPAPSRPAAPRQATSAARLAQELRLGYRDDGSSVLLADTASRVRLYPGSNLISVDGRDLRLKGRVERSGPSIVVPGPAASLIEGEVLRVRRQRAIEQEALAALPPPPPPPAFPRPVAVVPPKTVAPPPVAPAPPPGVTPDPGWTPACPERAWKWIVLHHSDDVRGNLAKYHSEHLSKGWENGCGYHFVIGNGTLSGDGEIEVGPRWRQQIQGAHAKTDDNAFNEWGIGICLVGDFENGGRRPTAAQMRSLARLCQWLMDRYGIGLCDLRGHSDCKPTACPGRNFPWSDLRARLGSS